MASRTSGGGYGTYFHVNTKISTRALGASHEGCRGARSGGHSLHFETGWSVPPLLEAHGAASQTGVEVFRSRHVERAWRHAASARQYGSCSRCVLCRRAESEENLTRYATISFRCFLTPYHPLRSQEYPKLTHTRVPRTALACCLGATAATLISNRADARALAACSALLASRRVRAGLTRRHRTRSRWAADMASRRGYARAASHSPQGHRSPPARGPCRPLKPRSRPRFAPTPYCVRGLRPCSRRPAPRR